MLTAEQKKQRLGKVTSSLAAAALGLNPHKTPFEAWLEVGGKKPEVSTKATQRGDRLEDLVLQYPADELGLRREPAPFRPHPSLKWAGDSADALYYRRTGSELVLVGEGKTASLGAATGWGEEGSDDVPDTCLVQSHWHLIHWPEVDRCVVPVLVGGYQFEFRLYYVNRNDELEGLLLQELGKWHRDYVQAGKPPPSEAGDTEYLRKLYSKATAGFLPDSPDLEEWARAKAEAAEHKKAAELDEERAKNRLRQLLGDHEGVRASWGTVTNRNSKSTIKIDWQTIAQTLGAPDDLIAQHTFEVPGHRSLRVNVRKADDVAEETKSSKTLQALKARGKARKAKSSSGTKRKAGKPKTKASAKPRATKKSKAKPAKAGSKGHFKPPWETT